MEICDLISFLGKKGICDTFKVLTRFKNYRTDKHTFYSELNKFSYYNSFFRVKEELIETRLIEINEGNEKNHIKLTEKGANIYNKLVEINEIFNDLIKNDKDYIFIPTKCCKAHCQLVFDTTHQKFELICGNCRKPISIGIKCDKCGGSKIKIEYF